MKENREIKEKTYLVIILIVFLFTSCSYDHIYIANTNFKQLKKAELKDYGAIGIGLCASFLTHELAHITLLEIFNADYKIKLEGTEPYIYFDDKNLSNNKVRWVARAGLLSQNLVGLFLSKDSYFTLGYNSMSAIQTLTYPLRSDGKGDLNTLNEYGGDSNLEWGIYSLISLHNLLRIEW